MSSKTIISFSFPCYAHHRDLHSFPTRRSSDLYDNIPVLSWLLLGGKCRNCKNRISVLYPAVDRKSTRLNSSHLGISYAVFCLKKKTNENAHLSAKERATDVRQ